MKYSVHDTTFIDPTLATQIYKSFEMVRGYNWLR